MIVAIPPLLMLTTFLVFKSASKTLGQEMGYLIGFGFYWIFWCLAIPWLLMGNGLTSLLTNHAPLFRPPNWLAALVWIIITLVTLVMYGKSFIKAPLTLILFAIPLATINGICEEILWRGLYVSIFPENFWLAILYPSIGFALWHLVPLSIFSDGNKWKFILSTFFLGLAYGFIAYKTDSVLWTAVSHSLGGILALSGMLAPSLLSVVASDSPSNGSE